MNDPTKPDFRKNKNRHRRRHRGNRFEAGFEEEVAEVETSAPAGPPAGPSLRPGSAPVSTPAAAAPAPVRLGDRKVVIGLTGEPGSGKSALSRSFARLGAQIIDVDREGHELLTSPAVKAALIQAFGDGILDDHGNVTRPALAALAFRTAAATATLNRIVHPPLIERIRTLIEESQGTAVVDAALLHELGLNTLCKQTVYVRAPREIRLARVQARGWDSAELERREKALGDADHRRRACGLTVENSGDPTLLDTYARTILARALGVDIRTLGSDPRRPGNAPSAAPASEGADHPGPDSAEDANRGMAPVAPMPVRDPVRVDLNQYLKRELPDLQEEGERLDVREVRWLRKHDLICEILRRVAGGRADEIEVDGYVELFKDQHGYLRSQLNNYAPTGTDAFISGQQLRRYGLHPGMFVKGLARAPRPGERNPQVLTIKEVMGEPIDHRTRQQAFISLTPLHPTEQLHMERFDQPDDLNLRIIDLVAPIGKGQRGLIVAQPKCGKTTYLQKIANAISKNNPEVTLMVLLVDERPEEVTDMERHVKAEVIASTFDQPASRHIQLAEMTINKARRLVERGDHVVILLDSITRLSRAYNTEAPPSGRIMSGGLEAGSLVRPRQFLASARNIENGGSLTILGTCLVDTGSVMDNVIFEEFKATGNMELVLDRRLANKRIFPAVDVIQSGTRKEDLMIRHPDHIARLWALRRFLAERSPQDAIEFLKKKLSQYKTNAEFLMHIDPDKMNMMG